MGAAVTMLSASELFCNRRARAAQREWLSSQAGGATASAANDGEGWREVIARHGDGGDAVGARLGASARAEWRRVIGMGWGAVGEDTDGPDAGGSTGDGGDAAEASTQRRWRGREWARQWGAVRIQASWRLRRYLRRVGESATVAAMALQGATLMAVMALAEAKRRAMVRREHRAEAEQERQGRGRRGKRGRAASQGGGDEEGAQGGGQRRRGGDDDTRRDETTAAERAEGAEGASGLVIGGLCMQIETDDSSSDEDELDDEDVRERERRRRERKRRRDPAAEAANVRRVHSRWVTKEKKRAREAFDARWSAHIPGLLFTMSAATSDYLPPVWSPSRMPGREHEHSPLPRPPTVIGAPPPKVQRRTVSECVATATARCLYETAMRHAATRAAHHAGTRHDGHSMRPHRRSRDARRVKTRGQAMVAQLGWPPHA